MFNVENQCMVVFYHPREWWLICGGVIEMELVCEGLNFLGYALAFVSIFLVCACCWCQ